MKAEPARFDKKSRACVEPEHCRGEVFDFESFGVPVSPIATHVGVLTQEGTERSGDGNGAGEMHQCHCEVEEMNSQIEHGAGERQVLFQKSGGDGSTVVDGASGSRE